MSDLQHSKPVRLAHAALLAAMARKHGTVNAHVQRLHQECGDAGLTTALIAWCDALHGHMTDGDMRPVRVQLAMADADSGALMVDDTTRPELIWARRLVAARLAMDEVEFMAVLDEVRGTNIGKPVWAVLDLVAATINSLPRGYVLMGRGAS